MRRLLLFPILLTLAACGDPDYPPQAAPHRGPQLRPLENYSTLPAPEPMKATLPAVVQ